MNQTFQSDYIPPYTGGNTHALRRLRIVVRPSGKKEKKLPDSERMKYVVIDPVNGITYDLPFDRSYAKVYKDHCAKIKHQCLREVSGYGVDIKKVRRDYYFIAEADEKKRLVYHIYSYEPIPIEKRQGLYEILRIVFYKDEAWIEDRNGRRSLTAKDIFARGSVIQKARTDIMDALCDEAGFPIEWPGHYNNTLLEHPELVDVDNLSFLLQTSNLPWPSFVAQGYLRSKQAQRFYKDVPEDVKEFLMTYDPYESEYPLIGALPDYLALLTKIGSSEYGYAMAVVGPKQIWYFTYNRFAKKWNSHSAKKGVNYSFAPYTRPINRVYSQDLYKGTCLSNSPYPFTAGLGWMQTEVDPIRFAYLMETYECMKQAVRIGRIDLLYLAYGYCKKPESYLLYLQKDEKTGRLTPYQIDADTSLEEVCGISDFDVTLDDIPYLGKCHNSLNFYNFRNVLDELLALRSLDIKTALKLTGCNLIHLQSTLSIYKKEGTSPINFLKDLSGCAVDRQYDILDMFTDLHYGLGFWVKQYLAAHPEENFDFFPPVSLIEETYDRALELEAKYAAECKWKKSNEAAVNLYA